MKHLVAPLIIWKTGPARMPKGDKCVNPIGLTSSVSQSYWLTRDRRAAPSGRVMGGRPALENSWSFMAKGKNISGLIS